MTLWEEMLGGRVQPRAFLDAALHAVPREPIEQNVQLVLGYVDRAFWVFLPADARGALSSELERLLRAGITRAGSSSLKSTYFSAFRSAVTTPDGVALSRARVAPAGEDSWADAGRAGRSGDGARPRRQVGALGRGDSRGAARAGS